MLKFEIEVEDADWWVEVIRDSNSYDRHIGNISCSIINTRYLFSPAECVCLSLDEMLSITDKMKEMENARTKAD